MTISGATGSQELLLSVKDLGVELPTGPKESIQAVKNVSLDVRPGERVGIVGESGSGKSITGRAIAGLLPTSSRVHVQGSIKLLGEEYVGAPRKKWDEVRKRRVSMIFQDPLSFLNPTMRIGPQIREALPPGRDTEQTWKQEVYSFMEIAGLTKVEEVAAKFPFELSGGMRQRVLIAIALAKKPQLIIADEPTTALDVTVQKHVLESLDRSVAELGTSLIMISHDLAVVAGLCDRIYVMYNGRIVESGTTRQVFTEPKENYTKALLRSVRSLSDSSPELYSISEDRSSLVMEGA